jgi:hypothetical protein
MKAIIDQSCDDYLECPFCDGNYHHIIRVGTELSPDGDETVMYAGTSLLFERTSSERRSALRIDFHGECGHYWTLIFQQHKGTIFVCARPLERPPCTLDEWNDTHFSTDLKMQTDPYLSTFSESAKQATAD